MKRIGNIRIVTDGVGQPCVFASYESLHHAHGVKHKVLTNSLGLVPHFERKEMDYRDCQDHHNGSDRKHEPLVSDSNGIFGKRNHNENDEKCEEYS